jgi:autotransporter strand-loop-strand O-heptosyltransferase
VSERVEAAADYVVIDKENPVIHDVEYERLGVSTFHFMNYPDFEMTYSFDFNHGYAALKLIKNGAAIALTNNHKVCHFVNYDYVLADPTVIEEQVRDLEEYDLVGYAWGHSNSINTGLFTMKTQIAVDLFEKFKRKEDYAKHSSGAILEDLVYLEATGAGLKVRMSDLALISKNNVMNAVACPTRPTLKTKNGDEAVVHLAKDDDGIVYLFAQGSNASPLKFEIITKLGVSKKRVGHHPVLFTRIPVEVLNDGFEVFFQDQNLTRKYDGLDKMAKCNIKKKEIVESLDEDTTDHNERVIHFVDGPFVEIKGRQKTEYLVKFIDDSTESVVYSTRIENNHWCRCSRKYYTDWRIEITNLSTGETDVHRFDTKGKRVLVNFGSSSLGDTLAWFPYIEDFARKHSCKVVVSTFKNELFKSEYPELEFISPGEAAKDIYASYEIGWFYENGEEFDRFKNPRNVREIPLQATATDILGLDYVSKRPRISIPDRKPSIEGKYVCIGIHATAQAKYWNSERGWQELTDYFNNLGYKVVLMSLEEDGYMGNPHPKGVIRPDGPRSLANTISYLNGAELFVGVGSGLSWLAWATGTQTCIISGFSFPYTEPADELVIRVFNPKVCTGCFNRRRLDAGDWNWCPDKKGTNRQFECTRTISSKDVIEKIEEHFNKSVGSSAEGAVQDAFALGMVQNYSEILEAARFFKQLGVTDFIEIGTDQGGTFLIWSKLSDDGVRISVDLPHGAYGQAGYDVRRRDRILTELGSKVNMLHGSSHDQGMKDQVAGILDGKKVDFLFIDGDHSYEGVRQDYEMYREFVKPGGWIGFHDISDTEFHRSANCRVDRLWSELDGEKVEFIQEPRSHFGGIGFIRA